MGALPPHLDLIAHVIQLSVAPVFLLTAIAGLLGVLANRLARAVDRAREIERILLEGSAVPQAEALRSEHAVCARRSGMILRAIGLCVVSGLLVCAVIVGLFMTAYYQGPDLTRIVGVIFSCALLALIAGLLTFLREVYIATATLRFGAHVATAPSPKARTRRSE